MAGAPDPGPSWASVLGPSAPPVPLHEAGRRAWPARGRNGPERSVAPRAACQLASLALLPGSACSRRLTPPVDVRIPCARSPGATPARSRRGFTSSAHCDPDDRRPRIRVGGFDAHPSVRTGRPGCGPVLRAPSRRQASHAHRLRRVAHRPRAQLTHPTRLGRNDHGSKEGKRTRCARHDAPAGHAEGRDDAQSVRGEAPVPHRRDRVGGGWRGARKSRERADFLAGGARGESNARFRERARTSTSKRYQRRPSRCTRCRGNAEVVEYLLPTNEVQTIRSDTGEVISTRPADKDDLQEDMFLDELEPGDEGADDDRPGDITAPAELSGAGAGA